jgi:hypothetical protein
VYKRQAADSNRRRAWADAVCHPPRHAAGELPYSRRREPFEEFYRPDSAWRLAPSWFERFEDVCRLAHRPGRRSVAERKVKHRRDETSAHGLPHRGAVCATIHERMSPRARSSACASGRIRGPSTAVWPPRWDRPARTATRLSHARSLATLIYRPAPKTSLAAFRASRRSARGACSRISARWRACSAPMSQNSALLRESVGFAPRTWRVCSTASLDRWMLSATVPSLDCRLLPRHRFNDEDAGAAIGDAVLRPVLRDQVSRGSAVDPSGRSRRRWCRRESADGNPGLRTRARVGIGVESGLGDVAYGVVGDAQALLLLGDWADAHSFDRVPLDQGQITASKNPGGGSVSASV